MSEHSYLPSLNVCRAVSFAHFAVLFFFSFIGCANYELFLFFFALFLALWYTRLAVVRSSAVGRLLCNKSGTEIK